MRTISRILLPILLLPCFAAALPADEETGFVPLFDGETFDGWEGNLKIFRIQEGAIVGGSLSERIPQNEFLCTKKQYGDFELRLQAKLVGKGDNAGVQFRSQRIPNHHEVIGYQCDMGGTPERSIWGSLYDESRRRRFLAHGDNDQLQKVLQAGDWNELTIRCQGQRIQIWVNGFQTIDYTEADPTVASAGIIGLQIHGGEPAEASYKNIRIKEFAD